MINGSVKHLPNLIVSPYVCHDEFHVLHCLFSLQMENFHPSQSMGPVSKCGCGGAVYAHF
jgi:hypothetical protein